MKLFRERGGASLALPLVLFALLSISSIVFVDAQSFRSSAFDPSFDIDDRGADGSSSSSELLAHQKFASKNLFWGTYRPQLYFGLRPRAPESLLSGLAWFGMGNYDAFANGMRHECAEKDGLGGYGWKWHDGRSFGVQEVRDGNLGGNNVRLETSFYKVTPAGGEEGEEEVGGGSWAARVSGEAIDPSKPLELSAIFYFGLEGSQGFLTLDTDEDESGLDSSSPIKLSGSTPELGEFGIRIEEAGGNAPIDPQDRHREEYKDRIGKTQFAGIRVPRGGAWRAKEIIQADISTSVRNAVERHGRQALPSPALTVQLSNEIQTGANFWAFQKTFSGNFSFDVFFDSASTPHGSHLDSASLSAALEASKRAYDERFEKSLGLRKKGFSEKMVDFARELTASMIGGVGYYFGQSIVDRSFAHEYDAAIGSGALDVDQKGEPDPRLTEPEALFTATPSRSMFPRGFYWDEGFHLAVIGAWDNDLSLDILKSWIGLIDEDGWVAREQILGEEARSRVPTQFQTQYPTYANPPTLIMAVTRFIDRLSARGDFSLGDPALDGSQAQMAFDSESSGSSSPSVGDPEGLSSRYLQDPLLARAFLRSIYAPLRTHYLWFRRTQRGEIKEWERSASARNEAFRWRGRTRDHVLTSGLDDYPRAEVPHSGELHVDLMAWMGFFADTMRKVARAVGETDDEEEYERNYRGIVTNLEDLHWSEEQQMYCDASVDKDDQSYHVCHRGYISLFPFLLGLLPSDSPHLSSIFEMLRDPVQLWSPYGIRSLSKDHPLYGKGENYWRGPVWIQMNYLALGVLYKKYAAEPGPMQEKARQIYTELRDNVVNNTFKEYERTGYAWEQYDPESGKGQRSHPFTGWTSTVALIMAENY